MKRAWPILLACAATVVWFHRVVLSGEIFAERDILRVYYPLSRYWAQQVASGSFPLWYPDDALGQPLVPMMIAGVFHPARLLYLVLPLGAALTVNELLCFPLALLGVRALLLRSGATQGAAMFGGTVFAFSGYLVSITNNLLYLTAAATVPWVLWAADRFAERKSFGRWLLGSALLASVLFAGDALSFAVAAALVGLTGWLSGRKSFAPLLVSLGGAGLAAPVLATLPSVQPVADAAANTRDSALAWSMHPLRFVDWVFGPLFAPGSGREDALTSQLLKTGMGATWAGSHHLGLIALTLAGVAAWRFRTTRPFQLALVAFAALTVLALGRFGGLFGLLYDLVPPWRGLRFPEKLAPFLVLGVALAAGLALRGLTGVAERRRLARLLAAAAALCAGLAVVEATLHPWGTMLGALHLSGSFVRGAAVAAVCGGLGAGALWFAEAQRAVWALTAIAFVGSYVSNASLPLFADAEVLEPPSLIKLVQQLQPQGRGGARLSSVQHGGEQIVGPGLSGRDSEPLVVVNGLGPCIPSLWDLEGTAFYLPAANRHLRPLDLHTEALGPLFGARFTVEPRAVFEQRPPGEATVAGTLELLQLVLADEAKVVPRAYLAWKTCVPTREALDARLSDREGWGRLALEVCPEQGSPQAGPVPGSVRVALWEPERLELQTDSAAPSTLVVNDAWYPGWEASVDGVSAPIVEVNGGVRGVELPKGSHQVSMAFHQPGLALGLGLGLFTLAAAFALSRVARSKQVTNPPPLR